MKKDNALSASLGRKLRDCRGTRPAREIASRLGITQQTLTGYERGRAYPDLPMLVMLARTYGVTTDWLLGVATYPCSPLSRSDTVDILKKMVEIESDAQARRMALLGAVCRN